MGEENEEANDGKSTEGLLGRLGTVPKVAGVLGAFGYLSLRAQLNHLGLPGDTRVEPERYLYETWFIAWYLFVSLCYLALPILVLLIIANRGLARQGGLRAVADRLDLARKRRLPGVRTPVLLLFILLVTVVVFDLGSPGVTELLGRTRIGGSDHLRGFDAIVLGWMVAMVIAFRGHSAAIDEAARLAWRSCQVVGGGLGVALVLYFGAYVHDRKYPEVEVRTAEGPTRGVLLLERPESWVIYAVEGGEGVLKVVPSKDASATIHDKVDVVEWALKHKAPRAGGDVPSVPPILTSPTKGALP